MNKEPIIEYLNSNYSIGSENAKEALQCLELIKKEFNNMHIALSENASKELPFLIQIVCNAQNMAICMQNGGAANYILYNNVRDEFMAKNVMWISDYEKEQNHSQILISGHNSHIAFEQQFYTPMGGHLHNELDNKYFAIGTDYYNTICNMNAAGVDTTRGDYNFCSADIFASNAQKINSSYYLDFDEAMEQGGTASDYINREQYMGSIGEGYSFSMHFLPMSHRVKAKPADMYNAMVFYYKTTPIEIY